MDLDSRLRGNDEGVVDSRLCGGGNDGSGSCGGCCVLATGCEQGGAKNQAQEGYCRLPIADCRLPIADCRLPIADCRLPIADSTATAFAVRFPPLLRSGENGLVGLCHVFSSCVMPMTSATDKSHYTHKNPNIKVFCKKICHSRPRLREGRLRRESTAAGRRMLMARSAI